MSSVSSGFVATLVGFTSTIALIFHAARSLGATPDQVTSWVLALGIGMGLSLVPMRAAAGRAVRPYAPFGAEADMRVSLYAWDDAGPTAELVAQMAAVLAER